MTTVLTDAFGTAWRQYNTDGVPGTGNYKPGKATIRAIGPTLDAALDAHTAAIALKQDASAKLSAISALTWANKKLLRLTGTATLDTIDYEEGSWTPSITYQTPGDLSLGSVTTTGTFTRTGNNVTVRFSYVGTPTFTTASGALRITGLPFVAADTHGGAAVIDIDATTWNNSATYVVFRTTASQSYLYIDGNKAAGGSAVAPLTATNTPTATALTIIGNLTYRTT